MSEGPVDFVGQVRAHLESLRAAGLLFVPRGAIIVPPRVAAPPAATPTEPASESPVEPAELRQRALAVLTDEVAACDRCAELYSTRTQTVFGTGPLDAEIAFVGEAPGPDEDARGEPFVGKGGQLLGRIIAACGFTREHVYLFNIIKCRAPKNRTPTMAECANCRDFFRRQFDLVKPKYVVALGQFVSRLLARTNLSLAELRETVHEYRGVPLICTHHPDEIEKDATGTARRNTWEDMKLLLRTMGRSVPSAK